MKLTKKHIDIDKIGIQEILTKEDINFISEYFKNKRISKEKSEKLNSTIKKKVA